MSDENLAIGGARSSTIEKDKYFRETWIGNSTLKIWFCSWGMKSGAQAQENSFFAFFWLRNTTGRLFSCRYFLAYLDNESCLFLTGRKLQVLVGLVGMLAHLLRVSVCDRRKWENNFLNVCYCFVTPCWWVLYNCGAFCPLWFPSEICRLRQTQLVIQKD